MTSKARLLLPLAVVAVTGMAAWWWFSGGADRPVTDDEARAYLDKIFIYLGSATKKQSSPLVTSVRSASVTIRP